MTILVLPRFDETAEEEVVEGEEDEYGERAVAAIDGKRED